MLFVLTFGTIDMGLMMFTWTLMEGSMREASRYGLTGAAPDDGTPRLDAIKQIIESRSVGMIDWEHATISIRAYPTFQDVGKPEHFTDGEPLNGAYDPGEEFHDCNNNGAWDDDRGRADDAGGSGEVVVYSIDYNYQFLTPFIPKLIGNNGRFPLSATVVVRNEPWDTLDTAADKRPCEP